MKAELKVIPVCPHCGKHLAYVPLAEHVAACPVVRWHLPSGQSNEVFARLVRASRERKASS